MSRVLWHTRDHGTAELRGSERAYAAQLARKIALGIVWPSRGAAHELLPFLTDPPAYVRKMPAATAHDYARWESSLETHLMVDGAVLIDGESISFGDMALNTLITMNGSLRLLAWLHGLCELHGYFEAEAQPLLAETILRGLDSNVLREGEGWEDVVRLIGRVEGTGPIVWSYSVCDGFPSYDLLRPPRKDVEEDHEYEYRAVDAVEAMSETEQWDRGMTWLRAQKWPVALDLKNDQRFLGGETAFDLAEQLERRRRRESVRQSV